jgi:SET domain-containing protein
MFYFKLENRNSNLHGAGLYALERIPQKSIVFYWGRDGDETVISEDEYLQMRVTGDKIFQKSACRWVYNKFVYSTTLEVDDNINHSFDPNILYYQGLGIAKRDILIGDELTINYEYILSENDTVKFMDKETNKTVTGISADSNLDKSSKELSLVLKNR